MTQPIDHQCTSNPEDYAAVFAELVAIHANMNTATNDCAIQLEQIHPNYQHSARNLLHYLVLRGRDLRPLQRRLAALGLSSLGRAESHVMATVNTVIEVAGRLSGCDTNPIPRDAAAIDFATGEQLLTEHTNRLLDPPAAERSVRIMVTMPSEAADNYALVHDLLQQGMDCMRINCAHDNPASWLRMIDNLRQAENKLGLRCKVVMDLAGPKLRTGPVAPGPAVARIHPQRDAFGRVTAPARVWLTSITNPQPSPTPAAICLQLPEPWLAKLHQHDRIKLIDARDSKRTFNVVDITDSGCWAEARQTTYLTADTELRIKGRESSQPEYTTPVGELPASEGYLVLHQGDLLIVTRNLEPGRSLMYDSTGQLLTPATIGCTIPEVFDDARPGESIYFDDGKIGGVLEKIERDQVLVRITQSPLTGAKLRSDKGINLPESKLRLPALTAKDLEDLNFVARHADIVELSFANTTTDVEQLQRQLTALNDRQPAIVLKIETRRGFENLPEMLLTAMRWPCCGVMIARGDLAVESGFERLAEVQEEILWICEAAHVPVIWATQVLESLAKDGMPSRAEITDAAMADRAECVMLNKGPHILHAVRTLDDILRRMQTHQTKKRSMLRKLRLANKLSRDNAQAPDLETTQTA